MSEPEASALSCSCHGWFQMHGSVRCMELKVVKLRWGGEMWCRLCWGGGYGPDFQARWGFRSWTKDGIQKQGRKHQQGDNVCKSMARTSLEITVKLSKMNSPSVILYDADVLSYGRFNLGSKSWMQESLFQTCYLSEREHCSEITGILHCFLGLPWWLRW